MRWLLSSEQWWQTRKIKCNLLWLICSFLSKFYCRTQPPKNLSPQANSLWMISKPVNLANTSEYSRGRASLVFEMVANLYLKIRLRASKWKVSNDCIALHTWWLAFFMNGGQNYWVGENPQTSNGIASAAYLQWDIYSLNLYLKPHRLIIYPSW